MVKPGYKQTEVGVLPEDWAIKKLINLSDGGMQNGTFYEGSRKGTGVYFLNVGNLYQAAPIIPQTLGKFDASKDEIDRFHVKNGDLFFTRSSIVPSGIAYCNWYKDSGDNTTVFDSHVVRFKTDTDQVNPMYLYLQCVSQESRKYFISNAKVATMTTIDQAQIGSCLIPVPSLTEQKNIAEAISDADRIIRLLEKLIIKKKAIKQGAMQELLTGKRRLPGFSGKWQNFNLMKHSKIKARIGWQGLKKSEYLDSGYALLVTGTDFDDGKVRWDNCHYVTRSRYDQDQNIQIRNNDILITKDGSLGKVALVQELTKPATLNSGIFVIRPLQSIYDPVFVYHILSSFVFKNFLDRLSAGSTIIHLYQKDVDKFEFLLPPSIEEQKAIAAILSEMDDDIEVLEEELAKYRQVKQGMMQQLLTGKIRLKNDVVDSVHTEQKASAKKSPVRSAHNHQFDDAVAIAAIVDAFYSDKYPLGRVKVQKLLYLLHRHQAVSVSDFKKKAAGPYADTVRYKGGEPIAKKNKYIVSESGKQGTRYFRGENMAQALDYVERWGMQADLQWLKDNFLHASRNDLELFATVDMAICDLNKAGVPISVTSIKDLIASNKEWKAKLSKTYFSDRDIARAIKKCIELFD